MDGALVLAQVEDRAFDPSQGSAHDGLSADANVGSLIGTRHRQPDRSLHDARRLKVPLRPDNPGLSGIIQWCVECGRKYCGQSSKVSKTVSSSAGFLWEQTEKTGCSLSRRAEAHATARPTCAFSDGGSGG